MNDIDKRYTNLSEHDYLATFHDFVIGSMPMSFKDKLAFILDEGKVRKTLDRYSQEMASVRDAQMFLMELLLNREHEKWVEDSTPKEGK